MPYLPRFDPAPIIAGAVLPCPWSPWQLEQRLANTVFPVVASCPAVVTVAVGESAGTPPGPGDGLGGEFVAGEVTTAGDEAAGLVDSAGDVAGTAGELTGDAGVVVPPLQALRTTTNIIAIPRMNRLNILLISDHLYRVGDNRAEEVPQLVPFLL